MPTEQETKEVVKRLKREGWEERKGKGSHLVFKKGGKLITVPASRKEISLGTYRNIAKMAGWL